MEEQQHRLVPVAPYYVICGHTFRVGPRYSNLMYIGEGTYGVVVSALDTHNDCKVALKKVRALANRAMAQRTGRELFIRSKFNHENIVHVKDFFMLKNAIESLTHVIIVEEYMETSLRKILSSQRLKNEDVCNFLYQILCGLKYIHSANVIHRDLKPSNILLNSKWKLKISNFSLATAIDPLEDQKQLLTEYVTTRWYRAIEVMINPSRYTRAIDMWSVGCIFAEMLFGKPLFPGETYLQQVYFIVNTLGPPSESCTMSEKARSYLHAASNRPKIVWSALYPHANQQALLLLDKMLTYDPSVRITSEDALCDPYVRLYHAQKKELISEEKVTFPPGLKSNNAKVKEMPSFEFR